MRLAILIGGGVTLAALIVAWWQARESRHLQVEGNLRELAADTRDVGALLHQPITMAEADAPAISGTPPIAALERASRNHGVDPRSGDDVAQWRARLETILVAFARTRPEYAQLRYIGVADGGREIVRVNREEDGSIRVVPPRELQRKGDRPYFRNTIHVAPGQVYVSDVDLNQEHGRIQVPWVPTIRVGVPVFRPDGSPFGAVVLNVDLRTAYRAMAKAAGAGKTIYVTDDRGDFLLHPDTAKMFRFEFGGRAGVESQFPEAAAKLAANAGFAETSYVKANGNQEMGVGISQIAFDPTHPKRYLAVLLSQNYSDMLAATASAQRHALLVGLLVLPLALLLAWLLARQVVQVLGGDPAELEAVAKRISAGDLSVDLESAGRRAGGVMNALAAMTITVREREQRDQDEAWVRNNLLKVLAAARRARTLEGFATDVSESLAPMLGVARAAVYGIVEEADDDVREPGARYLGGFASTAGSHEVVTSGDGLVGQVLADGQTKFIDDVPEGYFPVQSGLGAAPPRHLVLLPLAHEGTVQAVLELATFTSLTKRGAHLLEEVKEDLGVAYWTLQSERKVAALLDSSRALSEELQSQAEELRVANEELETKSQELEQQSEELSVLNVELEAKSEELERRRTVAEKRGNELVRMSQYKSEFLANMSHELRTPLNSLLILAESLSANAQGNLTDEQVRSAQIILGGGRELLDLINELLDLSKIEAGKLVLHPEDVSPHEVATSLEAQFGPQAAVKGISFSIVLEDGVPDSIRSDRQRVGQILKNFLSNAFKFTQQGSISLTVAPASSPAGRSGVGRWVSFTVADTGIGIPEEKLQLIFEAFTQADGSTSRNYGGTGLGLTISRSLAEALGGSITVQSREGQGSTFTLLLPVEADPSSMIGGDEDPGVTEATMRSGSEFGHPGPSSPPSFIEGAELPVESKPWVPDDRLSVSPGDRSLLIVEDDRPFAEILVDLSRSRGYKVLATPSGSSALRLAEAAVPTAVILDLHLPDANGLDVLSRLKKNPETHHIPVHVISVLDAQSDALAQGAAGFVAKPTAQESLEAVFTAIESTADAGEERRVLVVEDELVVAEALRQSIRDAGIEMSVARSREEAERLLDLHRFRCIVLDLNLPDGRGLETLKDWQTTRPDLPPVIIHTGEDLDRTTYRQLQEFSDAVVVKGAASVARVLDEVTIFLYSVEQSMDAKTYAALAGVQDVDQALQGKRILLVDDDLRNAFALSQALSRRGLDIVLAEDGEMALETLAQEVDGEGIDLVLMDIMMPKMDGYQAMQRMRMDDRFTELPIIALTAKAMPEDRRKCLDAGANDYLTKPVDVNQLLSLIRVWLFGRKRS